MNRRILITGINGFVGQSIVNQLKLHNLKFYGTTSNYKLVNQETVFYLDLADQKSVFNVLNLLKPQVIIHTAALLKEQDPLRDISVNLLGSVNLVVEAAKVGLEKFIFSSSGGAIYGEVPDPQLAHPSWAVRPISPYATSKLAFEQYLHTFSLTYGFQYNILRYSNIIGKNQPKKGEGLLLSILLEKAKANQPLTIFGREVLGDEGCFRDYIDVDNVAMANLLCVQNVITEKTINISSAQAVPTLRLAELILQNVESKSKIEFLEPRSSEVKRSVLDNSEIRKYMQILEFDSIMNKVFDFERRNS